MTELILVAISALIVTAYITLYVLHCGIPTSLSDTYYHNEKKWLFPTVLALASGLALIPMMDATPEPYKVLSFFSIASIFFVAASPAFKDGLVRSVHCISAVVLGACVLAWLLLTAYIPILAIVGVIIGIHNRKHFVFWLEIGLLYDLYVNLIVLLINMGA